MSKPSGGMHLPPSDAVGCISVAASAVVVAVGIAALNGLMQALPFVLLVTLVLAGFGGLPVFVALRRRDPLSATAVLGCGFAIGAVVPAIGVLVQPAEGLIAVVGFGFAGAAGAALTWGLARWLTPSDARHGRWRRLVVAVTTIVATIGSGTVPSLYIDRSCHNPLRDGRASIGPVAGFDLRIPPRDWSALSQEIRSWALARRWQERHNVRPDWGFLWFQQSVCVDVGTVITVDAGAPYAAWLTVSVFQPQGGDGWQASLKSFQRHIETRWPEAVTYGTHSYEAPRPPWAPPVSTPALSATTH